MKRTIIPVVITVFDYQRSALNSAAIGSEFYERRFQVDLKTILGKPSDEG